MCNRKSTPPVPPPILFCENTLLCGCLLKKVIVNSDPGNICFQPLRALVSQPLLFQGEEAPGTWMSCWGPGSLAPQSLCVRGTVCHRGWQQAQQAKPLTCLLGPNCLGTVTALAPQRVDSCPHSYCLAGSSHSFALRWKDRLSHVYQKPKSCWGIWWRWHQGGEGEGHSRVPRSWDSPGWASFALSAWIDSSLLLWESSFNRSPACRLLKVRGDRPSASAPPVPAAFLWWLK